MPYIRNYEKEQLKKGDLAGSPGELNYLITNLLIKYLKSNGTSYQSINDCVGALECAKLEFTRRVVNKYEDQKIRENGDVYPVIL